MVSIANGEFTFDVNGRYIPNPENKITNIALNSGEPTDRDYAQDVIEKWELFHKMFMFLENNNYLKVSNRLLNSVGCRNAVTKGTPSVDFVNGNRGFSFSLSFYGANFID
jgi:hypothetical protein